jgi:hypothetical protein
MGEMPVAFFSKLASQGMIASSVIRAALPACRHLRQE